MNGMKGCDNVRVKLKDPQKHVEEFEFGKFYDICFYGASGFIRFQHTRKNHFYMMDMGRGADGKWTVVNARTKISKRELKQLLNEQDLVQWVLECPE